MIRLLLPALCLIAVSTVRANDLVDQDVQPPAATDLDARPKMAVEISAKGVPSLDGVSFSDQQLAVVFRRVLSFEPKVAVQIRADEKASFRHVKKVIELAKQAGIKDVVLSTARETKPGEQAGARQPATAVDSKSEGDEKPKSESEGRSQ